MSNVTISKELALQLHDLVLASAAEDPEHWAALKQLNTAMAEAAAPRERLMTWPDDKPQAAPRDTSEAENEAYKILRNGGYVTSGDACDIIDRLKPYLQPK